MTIQYTHKTRDGRPARIVCTDRQNTKRPVIALVQGQDGDECPQFLRPDLRSLETDEVPFLTEKSIWEDVEVDTPVWVRHSYSPSYFEAHFAKYQDGYVHIWVNGRTSHTTGVWAGDKSVNLTTAHHHTRVHLENPAYA